MNKAIPFIFFLMLLTTPCLGLEILSPSQNSTYNSLNVSLIYTTNASSVEMIINDDDPITVTENRTLEFDEEGDYYLTLTAHEYGNETIVNTSVLFKLIETNVDWCDVGIDILASHNCTEGIEMEIIRHECIPTKCEEMLSECQAEILPEMQTEYNSLKTKCVLQQADIEACKSEPWKWVVTVSSLLVFGLSGWGLWFKDNAL